MSLCQVSFQIACRQPHTSAFITKKQNVLLPPRGCAGRGRLALAVHSLSPLLGLRPRVYTLRHQYQLNFDFVDQLLGSHA